MITVRRRRGRRRGPGLIVLPRVTVGLGTAVMHRWLNLVMRRALVTGLRRG